MAKTLSTLILMVLSIQAICAQPESSFSTSDTLYYLNIPERSENAADGSEFVTQVAGLNIVDREIAVVSEILSGNVPSFSRKLRPIQISKTVHAQHYELIYFAACDYMAIGSDQDYLYIPMTPSTAQYLADVLDCSLLTKRIVDQIYENSEIKLSPQPIPPSDQMTTIQVFSQHTDSIEQQFSQLGVDRSANNSIGGHKKDIIISNKIYSPDRDYERVVIYGWHIDENNPIQPVYNGHSAMYADYSHGVRFVSKLAFINGDSIYVDDVLKDSDLSLLLSSEGVISKPYYPESEVFTSTESEFINSQDDFQLSQNYPNPFQPTTSINYQLSKNSVVDLSIFNLAGEKVVTLVSEEQPAGNYEVKWDALSYESGLYIYTLKTGFSERSRKMILSR